MPCVRLSVPSSLADQAALLDWLRADTALRGLVRSEPAPVEAGEMGAAAGIAVMLASSGTGVALARSVRVWLTQRHTDIAVTVTGPDRLAVTVEAKRTCAEDIENLIMAILSKPAVACGDKLDSDDAISGNGLR